MKRDVQSTISKMHRKVDQFLAMSPSRADDHADMDKATIPSVDPADLERVYEFRRTTPPDRAIGITVFTNTPGADIDAVCKRMSLLLILGNLPDDDLRQHLAPWIKNDGSWSPAAFRVAAKFPMGWLQRRKLYGEELEEFVRLIKAEEQNLCPPDTAL